MTLREHSYFDLAVEAIAQRAIDQNWFRVGKDAHTLTNEEVAELNTLLREPCVTSGSAFIDDDHGTTGMVRLYIGDSNPKWDFFVNEDGELVYDWC